MTPNKETKTMETMTTPQQHIKRLAQDVIDDLAIGMPDNGGPKIREDILSQSELKAYRLARAVLGAR